MQKVACPMIIVSELKGIPAKPYELLSEIPVTMPGRAMGNIIKRVTLSLPKNECLDKAAAASDPNTIAINVENDAIFKDNLIAFQISSL